MKKWVRALVFTKTITSSVAENAAILKEVITSPREVLSLKALAHFLAIFLKICQMQYRCSVFGISFSTAAVMARSASVRMTWFTQYHN